MAKTDNNIPALLIAELIRAEVSHSIIKGAIFYDTIDGYNAGQKIIKALEKRLPKQGYNKFGNKKVKLRIGEDFVTFDSEDEADFYFCLKDELDAGYITKIEFHPRLELFPRFADGSGKTQFQMVYTPDFYVEYADGRKEYIDVKGMSTEAGDLRRKLYEYLAFGSEAPARHFKGIPLRWVATSWKYGDKNGWINYDLLQQKRKDANKEKKAKGA